MAVVPDLAGGPLFGNGVGNRSVDRKLAGPNRNITGSPVGTTTPQYTGETVLDQVGYQLWTAGDLTVNGWVPVTKVV